MSEGKIELYHKGKCIIQTEDIIKFNLDYERPYPHSEFEKEYPPKCEIEIEFKQFKDDNVLDLIIKEGKKDEHMDPFTFILREENISKDFKNMELTFEGLYVYEIKPPQYLILSAYNTHGFIKLTKGY